MAQQQKKITKSKKWIDYSSEEEHEHQTEEKPTKQNHSNHQKIESHKDKHQNLPVLSTSHEAVNKHQLEDKRDLLEELRKIKGNTVWVVLSVDDDKNLDLLNNTIQNLKTLKKPQILSIYPSRELKKAFDLRIDYNLGEKWIVQGVEKTKGIRLQIRKKTQRRQGQKYEQNDRNYRPIRQYAPQHTTSTRYEPKNVQYREKQSYRSPNRDYEKNHNFQKPSYQQSQEPHEKIKYVEKNPLAEQIEQKVEEELKERKLQKKDKSKKFQIATSKIFSKNPYDAFNDSD